MKKVKIPDHQEKTRDSTGRILPGFSGNYKGRPKGISITEMVKKKLKECCDEKSKKTYGDKIIESIFNNAVDKKDVQMLKSIWSYIDGAPKQHIESSIEITQSGNDGVNKLKGFELLRKKADEDLLNEIDKQS